MKYTAVFVVWFSIHFANAQIFTFDSIAADNKITNFDNQKLIMIDFWATWCAPCIVATQQLEVFQEQNKDKIFVISLTDEGAAKIAKFLTKSPINLMVAIDDDKNIFTKYKIASRPNAVLLDINGKLLWQGHPSDLSQSLLDGFYKKTTSLRCKKFADIVKVNALVPNSIQENENVDIAIIEKSDIADDFLMENQQKNIFIFNGTLNQIIAKYYNISLAQIEFNDFQNQRIKVKCKYSDWLDMMPRLQDVFGFKITEYKKETKVKNLTLSNENLLWSANQISWDEAANPFLIGNDRITADNVTVKDIANMLSNVKNEIYTYDGENKNRYDWDFQYLYDDLMKDEFETAFGIAITKTKSSIDFKKIEPIKKE